MFHEHLWELRHACQLFPMPLPGNCEQRYPMTVVTEACSLCPRVRTTEWLGHVTLDDLRQNQKLTVLKLSSVEK